MVKLIRYVREPILIAFSTASSEAAYPKMLEQLDRFGVPRRIYSFVLPLGYSFNLDGSMMYSTFATIRSEEHTSELQSLMRISYAVFCSKKKNLITDTHLVCTTLTIYQPDL